MKLTELKKLIAEGRLDGEFSAKCGISAETREANRTRVLAACEEFKKNYDNAEEREVYLFSVGGRSEISGNHTDHNYGRVIAASINLDVIAIASPRDDGVIRIKSQGFPEDVVEAEDACSPDESKYFTSGAIIAGMERAFMDRGLKVGGFDAYTTSNVLKGSGLSSSAAFEVMVGNIISHIYNEGKVDNVEIAKMAQFAEREFFGKPCGLMDQMACAVGGFITIDFKDSSSPVIEKLDFDLSGNGYALCIVDTGGNHADLNADYASVPGEMKAVAAYFGKNVLRECSISEIVAAIPVLREKVGDRAILRAIHFLCENKRVDTQVKALKKGDMKTFLDGVFASGDSSYKYLQNVYTTKCVEEQGLSLALCLTELKLSGTGAAWRVHGGGFAGTIQAFVPVKLAQEYSQYMENVFGEGSCYTLFVRAAGAVRLA